MHPALASLKAKIRVEHVMLALLILAVVLRFCFLDLKLYHHDEAIHAYFSYNLASSGAYTYNPVYHGPFLYYVTAGMFNLFGATDLVGRLLPCIFGCALIPLVYWIYRMEFVSGKVACIASLFIAISPEIVYFARFLRNDTFVIFFSLLMICAMLAWFRSKKWYWFALAGAAAGLCLCCKENAPLIIITFLVFLAYLVWAKKVVLPVGWWKHALIGVGVFFAIVLTMYTSFWQHPEMALTAGPMAISHWLEMHGQNRLSSGLGGAFYLVQFFLYELPVLIFAIVGIVCFLRRPKKNVVPESAETTENSPVSPTPSFVARMKSLLSRPAEAPVIDKKREFMRFAIYWTIIACLTYAYVGEKVPWLSLHQLLPMVFVAAFGIMSCIRFRKVFLVLSVIFLLCMTCYVCYTPADIAEPIVQVQNSENIRGLMEEMNNSPTKTLLLGQEVCWPMGWYYHGKDWSNEIWYYVNVPDLQRALSHKANIMIMHDGESYGDIEGYTRERMVFKYWLSTANNDPVSWIKYYFTRMFTHEPIGSINVDVYRKIGA
jgi:TIGR03663 family protein